MSKELIVKNFKKYFRKIWGFVSHNNAPIIALEIAVFAGIIFVFASEEPAFVEQPTEVQAESAEESTSSPILNPHSHPKAGDHWTVSFNTPEGTGDLVIIPNDQATIDDLNFISLKCGEEEKTPKILENDVIFYPNWSCSEVAKVSHLVNVAGKHTLRLEFGDKIAYAYNSPWEMKQLIIGGCNDALSNSATEYNCLGGGSTWTVSTSRRQVISTPGTFSKLAVELSVSPGNSGSYTITLSNLTKSTSLAVTITDPDTTNINAGTLDVDAGDVIQLKSTYADSPSATPAARWSVWFKSDNASESLILGIGYGYKDSGATPYYAPIANSNETFVSVENQLYQIIPTSGVIKNLFVVLFLDPGTSPDAYRITLRVNGANSDDGEGNPLQVTIVADDKTGNDATHEIPVSAGDYVDMKIEALETPSSSTAIYWGMTFAADTDGESLILGNSSDPPTLAQTEYNHLTTTRYNLAWDLTENDFYQGGQGGVTLKKLYVKLSGTHTGNYVINVRATSAGGNTGITVILGDGITTGNDITHEYELGDYDDLDISCLAAGTARMVYWGLVAYYSPGNDFTDDSDVVALWKFNNNPNDSKGNNDLTAVNSPTYDNSDRREGLYSTDLEHGSQQYLYRADADLDAGFPGKSGTSEQSFSICCWVKLVSIGDPLDYGVVTKYIATGNKRTWALVIRPSTPYPRFLIGYNSGANATTLTFDTALSTGIWYHIAVVYDASDNGMKIRVWDDNAGALLDDNKEGTAGGDMPPSDAPLEVGRYMTDNSYCFDGKIDEVVIFKDVLTDDKIDQIRQGIYPLTWQPRPSGISPSGGGFMIF
jgi:hypothetical protein